METDRPAHYLSGKSIIIAGGGIAGLAFAIALHKQWPSLSQNPPPKLTIYERDSEEHMIGREGYSMSLRSDPPGGVQALQRLGLLDEVIDVSITKLKQDGAGFAIWNLDMSHMIKVKARVPEGLPVGGIRIVRKNLKAVMIKAAEQAGHKVNWGSACTQVRVLEDGKMQVQLDSGASEAADILIAADGASSKLRAQLRPSDTLNFQSLVIVSGTARFGPEHPPAPVHRDWGMLPSGKGPSAFMSPMDENSALWSIAYPASKPVEIAKSPVSGEEAKAITDKATELAALFPDIVKTLIDKTDPITLMRFSLMDKPPFAHPANGDYPRVIFIGDANHAVSPYAGNGANMALCDGWDLAEQLGIAGSVEEGLRNYDKIVVPRSTQVLQRSHFNIRASQFGPWGLWGLSLLAGILKFIFRNYVE